MEFRKFDSLENTYNEKQLQYVRDQLLDEGDWIVTEKVDGANFAFYYDGVEVKTASRNQFVDGTFYACQEVIERYTPAVLALYKELCRCEGDVLTVYGELIGPNVQGRVNYGPKDFLGFDVLIVGQPINKITALSAMHVAGFKVVPVIGSTSFEKALKVPNAFQSHVFSVETLNECEGVVIEPVVPAFFSNGKRVYLKHKTESFSEKKAPKKVKVEPEVPDCVSDMLQRVAPYLTESRVHSVLSKIGEVGKGDFGKVLKLTVLDAIDDFEKEFEVEVGRSLSVSMGLFMKLLSKEATATVREVFLSLVS